MQKRLYVMLHALLLIVQVAATDEKDPFACAKSLQSAQDVAAPDYWYAQSNLGRAQSSARQPLRVTWEPILESIPNCNGLDLPTSDPDRPLKVFSFLVILDASWVGYYDAHRADFATQGYHTLEESPGFMFDRVSYIFEAQFGVRLQMGRVVAIPDLDEKCAENDNKVSDATEDHTHTGAAIEKMGIAYLETDAAVVRLGVGSDDGTWCRSTAPVGGLCQHDSIMTGQEKPFVTGCGAPEVDWATVVDASAPLGWTATGFSGTVGDGGGCANGWNAYAGGDGQGQLEATMAGSGTATVEYADCWSQGFSVLYINNVKKDQTGDNTGVLRTYTFDFEDGDMIKFKDEGTNAVLYIKSITYQCTAAVNHRAVRILAHEFGHLFGICSDFSSPDCLHQHLRNDLPDIMVYNGNPAFEARAIGMFYKFFTTCTPVYEDLLCSRVKAAAPTCGVALTCANGGIDCVTKYLVVRGIGGSGGTEVGGREELHGVRCCGVDGEACVSSGLGGLDTIDGDVGCAGNMSWPDADRFCRQAGRRLCTRGELADKDSCKGTGCGLDDAAVWSSTRSDEEPTCPATKTACGSAYGCVFVKTSTSKSCMPEMRCESSPKKTECLKREGEGCVWGKENKTCDRSPCHGVVCSTQSGNVCETSSVCSQGKCKVSYAKKGKSCDDGDVLTKKDRCVEGGVCEGIPVSVAWVLGGGGKSCTIACESLNNRTCSESKLASLSDSAAMEDAVAKAGVVCSSWNTWNYNAGLLQCTAANCCNGACVGACSGTPPASCDAKPANDGQERICACAVYGHKSLSSSKSVNAFGISLPGMDKAGSTSAAVAIFVGFLVGIVVLIGVVLWCWRRTREDKRASDEDAVMRSCGLSSAKGKEGNDGNHGISSGISSL